MLKYVICLLLIVINIFANSLYTDDVNDYQALQSSEPSQETYNYSGDEQNLDDKNLNYLDDYSKSVFELSQVTHQLAFISDESIVYSDIKRLSRISKELLKLLGSNKINLNFKSVDSLSQLQYKYQESIYQLYVLSPYMPYLLTEYSDKTIYNIEYIKQIKGQIKKNVGEFLAVKNQLNLNQGAQLPFNPSSPNQLSFALENQLNSSIINMFGGSSSGVSDESFSGIATPPNANLLNQQPNSFFGGNAVSTPNGNPLQMMNYIPSF